MFTVADRNRARDRVLELASSDPRVVAGAVVGSLALGEGDRWSDLDLTFGVADGVPVHDVLEDWTRAVSADLGAVHLFDLPRGESIYRVFVLPGCLQLDLSFTPASAFGAASPTFRLLFGTAVDRPHTPPRDTGELFGYAVHHALRARFAVERGRFWLAEFWISAVRDYALGLACTRRGLPSDYGRGFDDLPAEVLDAFRDSFVLRLERDELLRALGCAVDGLRREAGGLAAAVEPQLRELAG